MTTALDTSVVVAIVSPWHEHHEAAVLAAARAMDAEGGLLVPSRVVLEAYSVLTRLPGRRRLAPVDAVRVLRLSFESRVRLLADAGQGWSLLERWALADVRGGQVYDADIVEAAVVAGARRILTFNRRHFERLVPEGVAVEVPTRRAEE